MGAFPAERMLAVYSNFVAGQEVVYHARIYEPTMQQVGYGEVQKERVRVLNREAALDQFNQVVGYGPATWELWEYVQSKDDGGKDSSHWEMIGSGPITIGIIPLVSFRTGPRKGFSWRVEPPLKGLAYMQVEEFQQESNLKYIKEMTAFPMLAGNGVNPQTADGSKIEIPVGPKGVLFAPIGGDGEHGEWKYIEPTSQSLVFLQSDLDKLRSEMRELGMQPMASANLTVVTTANVSMKASSAVQAWTLQLQDALETAWLFTCMWINRADKPEVKIFKDFAVDLKDDSELTALQSAADAGTISKRQHFDELKRRGVLVPEADWDENEEEVAEQQEGLEPEQPIDPVTGKPIVVEPRVIQ